MEKDAILYAITVTFSIIKSNYPKQQFNETIGVLSNELHKSTQFIIMPEWRATNGSIHYHGTLTITDKIKWYKSTLPRIKRWGYVLIKKIDDIKKWTDYMYKEHCIAQGILGEDIHLPIYRYTDIRKLIKRKEALPLVPRASIHDWLENEEENTRINNIIKDIIIP